MSNSNMEKNKYLFKNTLILFVSNFSSKILVFFLLPLYTSILTTSEYGISDLIHTTVNILYILLTFYVGSGILRFTMEKETDKNEMISIGLFITLISTTLVGIGSIVSKLLNLFPSINGFYGYLVLTFFLYCISVVFSSFTKGQERIRLIGVAGIISTVTHVGCNIFFLLVLKIGIHGYLMSTVCSYLASSLVYFFGGSLKGTRIILPQKETVVKVIKYSAPVAATELGWLICTSSDKYIVSFMLGTSATGIISAAHRLPTILSAFTSIFIQAWQISAIKEYGSKDNVNYYTQMFNYYNAFAVCAGAFLIVASKLLGSFLYRGEFAIAWIYTPIYLLALVINTLSSFSGTIIAASKDTKYLFSSTVVGAVVNLVLDVLLIHFFGIFGAGIATAISYAVIGCLRIKAVYKKYPIKIEVKRFTLSYILLILLVVSMVFGETTFGFCISLLLCLGVLIVNRTKIHGIVTMCLRVVKSFLYKQ